MANENNNNELVEADEDPTSELEALTWQQAEIVVSADSLEASEGTIDFGELTGNRLPDQEASRALDHLAYELEQERALRKGLEAEVKSRAEITETLNRQIEDMQFELERRNAALDKKTAAVKSLKREIRERNSAHNEARDELVVAQDSLADTGQELEAMRVAVAEKDEAIATLQEQSEADAEELAALRESRKLIDDELATALMRIDALEASAGESEKTIQTRDREIQRLQDAVSSDNSSARDGRALDVLLSSRERELIEFSARFDRLQQHTDDIRQSLQDAMADRTQLAAENAAFSQHVDEQDDRIRALSADLNHAHLEMSELQTAEADLVKAHEDEIRLLRFELGEAQATMSQNELINEQLASDLIQTRGFKESLEHMLEQNDENAQTKIHDLEKQLHKLRQDIVYFEEQLHTKNEAINCLLAELAAKQNRDEEKRRHADLQPKPEQDERSYEQDIDFSLPDSDRVSRFLIGEIDGKEVQFPLFKGRLTIGRAHTNDIHLTADYISRRHAVLVTEQDVTRIIDWGSRNGVRVNGRAVTEHFLTSGDTVRIGTFDFVYEERKRPDKT
ncbi:MAG: FHA domain-containing protein [Woeseiaceae bacterium]|nr:FHA domain-containing protein [Woeseiaceae bacterium]